MQKAVRSSPSSLSVALGWSSISMCSASQNREEAEARTLHQVAAVHRQRHCLLCCLLSRMTTMTSRLLSHGQPLRVQMSHGHPVGRLSPSRLGGRRQRRRRPDWRRGSRRPTRLWRRAVLRAPQRTATRWNASPTRTMTSGCRDRFRCRIVHTSPISRTATKFKKSRSEHVRALSFRGDRYTPPRPLSHASVASRRRVHQTQDSCEYVQNAAAHRRCA